MGNRIDLKGLIPSGNELRILLNSKHISDGEISSILKEKGVFCASGDKTITVPLSVGMLLTSDEYARLIDNSISRSLKPKNKISSLELVEENTDINKPIKEIFSKPSDFCKNIANIKMIVMPCPVFDGNDVRIRYQIERVDFSKDFLSRNLVFDGEILIKKKDGNLRLEFLSTHTSSETELINKRIGVHIAQSLKKSGIVKNEIEEKITFDSFEDVERVKFFKRLTAGFQSFLTLDNVNEILISRETSQIPIPNDPKISWMNRTVKRMIIDGERLHDIFLMSDEKYYQYYFINNMILTYKYNIGNYSGEIKVAFFFSSTSRQSSDFDKNSELTFEVIRINCKNKISSSLKKNIEIGISDKIRILIKNTFENILNERQSIFQK